MKWSALINPVMRDEPRIRLHLSIVEALNAYVPCTVTCMGHQMNQEETSKMLFLVVLFMFVAAAHGCSCKQEPLKKKFCEADYVSYVVIKKEDTSKLNGRDGIRIYEVEHKEVYKQPEGMQELPNNVTTPEHGAGCGVRLWVGEQFLIGERTNSLGTAAVYRTNAIRITYSL
ncbi:hypothetical protein Y032_0009g566 [Ancylostoma ceylanicum]|uniref:NTR domain-containing protein n=1 Tax=Ancylostoma ceylanicum TaxID=53326 RepID=A0A016VIS9_9BILA|nr:hypothetical protein Y032_0009g566 [Ancylostoma ceylanicum]